MAPAMGQDAAAHDSKSKGWSIFKPIGWQGGRKVKVAHEGDDMQMYFHPELKKWVEKGREHEATLDPGSAPPPTGVMAPSGTQRAGSDRSRRSLKDRYALQSNLSVSMDLDSLSSAPPSSSLLPPMTSISPPASTSNFFIPAPTSQGPASMPSMSFFQPQPIAAGCVDTPGEQTLWGGRVDVGLLEAPAPCPAEGDIKGQAQADINHQISSSSDASVACSLSGGGDSDPSFEDIPRIGSSAGSDCGSDPGSKSLHNGHKFAIPRCDQLSVLSGGGGWPSAPGSVCDSVSSRDQDFAHDAFDAAMHPCNAGKLDGPLPWELQGQLRYSEEFVSICTAWQRRNPGRLYSPRMLLPAVPEAKAPPSHAMACWAGAAAGPLAGLTPELPADADPGQRCAAEVVSYLQRVIQGLQERQDVGDDDIKHAMSLLSSLMGDRASLPCVKDQEGAHDTPTKVCTAITKAKATEEAQVHKLDTPQRLPSASVHMLDSSPEDEGGAMAGRQVAVRNSGKPRQHAAAPSLTVQQLARLKQELQDDYDVKLSARAAEIEARFEARLSEMRQELETEYERRLAERDAELHAQRQRCIELQDDLDNLLLCLGQESRKVMDLSQAMAEVGLDADAITMSIEEEYALMDLPATA